MKRPAEIPDSQAVRSLSALLIANEPFLLHLVRNEASGLLRFESVEDLAQGVFVRALKEAEGFEYRGQRKFLAWLRTFARRHIADRHDYWSAMRRGSGRGTSESAYRAFTRPPSQCERDSSVSSGT